MNTPHRILRRWCRTRSSAPVTRSAGRQAAGAPKGHAHGHSAGWPWAVGQAIGRQCRLSFRVASPRVLECGHPGCDAGQGAASLTEAQPLCCGAGATHWSVLKTSLGHGISLPRFCPVGSPVSGAFSHYYRSLKTTRLQTALPFPPHALPVPLPVQRPGVHIRRMATRGGLAEFPGSNSN